MNSVDPLNPLGGIYSSQPPMPPDMSGTSAAPPAVAPGQPVPRPAAQPVAGGQPPAAAPAVPDMNDPNFIAAEYERTKAKLDQLESVITQQRATASQREQDVLSSMNERPTAPAPENFNQPQPMPDAQAFAKQAPLLTVLAALGGRLTKMSGLTMLKATNAMIQGTMSGNQEAYTQARKIYDDEYAKFQDRQRQKLQIYRDQLEAWKDTYQGREKAWQIASNTVGDTLTQAKDVQSHEDAILRAWAGIKRQQKAEASAKDKERWFGLGEAAEKNVRSIEQSIPRIKMANDTVQRMKNDWPALMEDLKKALGPNATAPVPIGDLLKKYKDDPRVGEFVQRVNALKSALVVIESSGAGAIRSNQFIQQIFAKTAPDLFTSTAPQITEALRIDSKMIGDFYANQQSELKRQQQRVEFARSKVGLPSAEEPTSDSDIFGQADAIIGR